MARTVKTKAVVEGIERITVQLDSRTTIIVRSKEAFQNWLQRYPNAKILNN